MIAFLLLVAAGAPDFERCAADVVHNRCAMSTGPDHLRCYLAARNEFRALADDKRGEWLRMQGCRAAGAERSAEIDPEIAANIARAAAVCIFVHGVHEWVCDPAGLKHFRVDVEDEIEASSTLVNFVPRSASAATCMTSVEVSMVHESADLSVSWQKAKVAVNVRALDVVPAGLATKSAGPPDTILSERIQLRSGACLEPLALPIDRDGDEIELTVPVTIEGKDGSVRWLRRRTWRSVTEAQAIDALVFPRVPPAPSSPRVDAVAEASGFPLFTVVGGATGAVMGGVAGAGLAAVSKIESEDPGERLLWASCCMGVTIPVFGAALGGAGWFVDATLGKDDIENKRVASANARWINAEWDAYEDARDRYAALVKKRKSLGLPPGPPTLH